MTWNKIPC